MFKRTSLVAVLFCAFAFTALPSAEVEAAGYKGTRSSSFSSSNRGFGRSGAYTRPKAVTSSVPRSSRQQYTRPAPSSPYTRGQPSANGYRKPVQSMKSSTPYGQRPSGYKPRQVSSPMASRPRTTVINNYGSRSNFGGYNRGHYGGGYGGGMGGGMMGGNGGPGLGSMLLAGAGGAILGNMIYNGFSHTPSHSGGTTRTDTVSAVQADEIRQEQRIEDKLDQVNDKLDAQTAPQTAMAGPQGYSLPADAPLMMSPDFYKLGGSM